MASLNLALGNCSVSLGVQPSRAGGRRRSRAPTREEVAAGDLNPAPLVPSTWVIRGNRTRTRRPSLGNPVCGHFKDTTARQPLPA